MDRFGHLSIVRLVLPMAVMAMSAASVQAGSTQAAAPAPAPVRAVAAPVVVRSAPMMQAPRQGGAPPAANFQGVRTNAPAPNVVPTFSPTFQTGGQTTPMISGSGVGAPPQQSGRFNFSSPPGSGSAPSSPNTPASSPVVNSAPVSNTRPVFTPAAPLQTTMPAPKFSTAGPTTPMVPAPQQPTRITIAPAPAQSPPTPNFVPSPTKITLTPVQPRQNQIAAPAPNLTVAGPTTPAALAPQQPTRISVTPASNAVPGGSSVPGGSGYQTSGYTNGGGYTASGYMTGSSGLTSSGYNSGSGYTTSGYINGPSGLTAGSYNAGSGYTTSGYMTGQSGLTSSGYNSGSGYTTSGYMNGPSGLTAGSYNAGSGYTTSGYMTGQSGLTSSGYKSGAGYTTSGYMVSGAAVLSGQGFTPVSGGKPSQSSSGIFDTALATFRELPKASGDVGIGLVQGSASAIKNIAVGTGEAAIGVVKGAGAAVTHPVQTIEKVVTVVEHPVQAGKSIANTGLTVGENAVTSAVQGAEQFRAAINSGNGQAVGQTLGNVYTNVGTALIPGAGEVGVAAKSTTAVTDVARAAEAGGKIATDSKVLSANQGVNALSVTRAGTASPGIADKISSGHAFDKHVVQEAQFPGITSAQQFSSHINGIISNPSDVKTLSRGRTAYWDEQSKTVVISDPKSADGGTAFKPSQGKTYFNNLK
jgi:hypothetical protein